RDRLAPSRRPRHHDQDTGRHRPGHERQVQGDQRGGPRPESRSLLRRHMLRQYRLTAIAGLIAVTGVGTSALAQSSKQEDPIPAHPSQAIGAIERSFTTLKTPEPMMLFPQMKEQLQDALAFLRDSKAGINFRSFYRDELTNAQNGASTWREAWTA